MINVIIFTICIMLILLAYLIIQNYRLTKAIHSIVRITQINTEQFERINKYNIDQKIFNELVTKKFSEIDEHNYINYYKLTNKIGEA